MKKRTFLFDCSGGAGEQLIEILKRYTDAAYSIGGSGCAASSRQAIKEIIRTIQSNEICEINKRQRPVLKAAVKWFYKKSGLVEHTDRSSQTFNRLISLLQK